MSSKLFTPVNVGAVSLANRIIMAPLTRMRSRDDTDVPVLPLMADYYRQRANAGLIISEASQISPQGKGYISTPGIYNAEQVTAWQAITNAVHAKGGHIFLQLWHVGRISHSSLQPNNALPVAPSAIAANGKTFTKNGYVPLETPRALELGELPGIVAQYKHAAQLALEAGFDGVEIHAANGYLLEQFLRDSSNHRTDAYGGSIENRARLLLEVTQAVTEVWGGQRVGIRLSPNSPFNNAIDSNSQATYSYVVEQLNQFGLLYLHLVEGATGGPRDVENGFDLTVLRKAFNGLYIANNGYDKAMGEAAIDSQHADLVAYGRPFISNPDLVQRYKIGAPLNELDNSTLYSGGAKGYTDYPSLAAG